MSEEKTIIIHTYSLEESILFSNVYTLESCESHDVMYIYKLFIFMMKCACITLYIDTIHLGINCVFTWCILVVTSKGCLERLTKISTDLN